MGSAGVVHFDLPPTASVGTFGPLTVTSVSMGMKMPGWAILFGGKSDPNSGVETPGGNWSLGATLNRQTQGVPSGFSTSVEYGSNAIGTNGGEIATTNNSCSVGSSGNQLLAMRVVPRTGAGSISVVPQSSPNGAMITGGIEFYYNNYIGPGNGPNGMPGVPLTQRFGALLGGQYPCSKAVVSDVVAFYSRYDGTDPFYVDCAVLMSSLYGGFSDYNDFTPSFVFFFGTGNEYYNHYDEVSPFTAFPPGYNDNTDFSGNCIGIAVNNLDGTVTQKCLSTMEATGSVGAPYQVISSDSCYIGMNKNNTAKRFELKVSSFDNRGFWLTPLVGDDSQERGIGFLAVMQYNAALTRPKLFEISAPAATGNVTYSEPGFTPEACIIVGSGLSNWDVGTSGNEAGGFAMSAFTATEKFASSIRWEDGSLSGHAYTAGLSSLKALQWANGLNCANVVADLVGMTGTGFTLNYSATQSGMKGFCLALHSETLCGAPPPPGPGSTRKAVAELGPVRRIA